MDRPPAMIKSLVIGLGLVIVGLAVVLVFGVAERLGDGDGGKRSQDFGDAAVALPAGARVTTMAVEDDALSLLLELGSGNQAVLTVDRRTGEVLGTLELLPRSE